MRLRFTPSHSRLRHVGQTDGGRTPRECHGSRFRLHPSTSQMQSQHSTMVLLFMACFSLACYQARLSVSCRLHSSDRTRIHSVAGTGQVVRTSSCPTCIRTRRRCSGMPFLLLLLRSSVSSQPTDHFSTPTILPSAAPSPSFMQELDLVHVVAANSVPNVMPNHVVVFSTFRFVCERVTMNDLNARVGERRCNQRQNIFALLHHTNKSNFRLFQYGCQRNANPKPLISTRPSAQLMKSRSSSHSI